MPYIEMDRRVELYPALTRLSAKINSSGDFTFVLYKLMTNRLRRLKPRFFNIAIIIGCMVCAILEFYRKVVAPYEDAKIEENGDVI